MTTTAVGVDIGGTKILGVALDPGDPTAPLSEKRVATPPSADELLSVVHEMVRALGDDVGSVGVGVAGLVDRRGVLRVSPNLPHLRGLDLPTELRRRAGHELPMSVDNDGTCAAWGEHVAGAGRGAPDAVVLTLGTGVGGGVIVDGRILRGAHGFAAEVGHMVVDPDGPPCPCGRSGCWERYASGRGLARLARDLAEAGRLEQVTALAGGDPCQVRGEHVAAAARQGDRPALDLLDRYVGWVALGLGNLVTLLDCSLVVIGGGLVEMSDLLMEPLRAALPAAVMCADERDDLQLVTATLGNHAGAIGAAMLSVDAPLPSP